MFFLNLITLPAPFIHYTAKLTRVVFDLRHTWQGFYFLSYGIFETLKGRVVIQKNIESPQLIEFSKRINIFVKSWQEIGKKEAFSLIHGALFFKTGLFLSLEGLDYLNIIDLGSFLNPIQSAGAFTFVCAKTLSLQYHVRIFLEACEKKNSEEVFHQKISAITGIIKTLGYLLLILIPLLGGSTALALVFGCIGVTTGAIKVLHDFFYVA